MMMMMMMMNREDDYQQVSSQGCKAMSYRLWPCLQKKVRTEDELSPRPLDGVVLLKYRNLVFESFPDQLHEMVWLINVSVFYVVYTLISTTSTITAGLPSSLSLLASPLMSRLLDMRNLHFRDRAASCILCLYTPMRCNVIVRTHALK